MTEKVKDVEALGKLQGLSTVVDHFSVGSYRSD